MPYQLLYTSVPTGLRPGTSGYTTAAHTEGMPGELVSALESKSGYDHLAAKDASFNGVNPIISRFEILQLNCGTFFVMSRLQDSGADHTGRTNYLAQHLVIDTTDLMGLQMNPEINPASILALGLNPPAQADGTIWRPAGPVKTEHLAPMDTQSFIQRVQQLGGAVNLSGGAAYWRECNLSPAQAPALLEGGRQTKCCLSYKPGYEAHLLRLISETLRISIERENPTNGQKRSPQEAWRYPFSVFVQSGGSHQEFVWCGFAGPAQQEAVAAGNQMVDLFGGQMPQSTDARLSSFAETGAEPYVEPPAPEPQQPVAAQPMRPQPVAGPQAGGPKAPMYTPPGTSAVQPATESGNDRAFLQAQQQAFALQAAGDKKAKRKKLLKLAACFVLLAGIVLGVLFWQGMIPGYGKDREKGKDGQKIPGEGNAANGGGGFASQLAELSGGKTKNDKKKKKGSGKSNPPKSKPEPKPQKVTWANKGELDKRLDFYFKSKGKPLAKIYVLNDFWPSQPTESRSVPAPVIQDIAAFFPDCSEKAQPKIKDITIEAGLLHHTIKPEPVTLAFSRDPVNYWTQQGTAPEVWPEDAAKKDTKFRLCSVNASGQNQAGFFEFPSPYKGAYYIDFTKKGNNKTIRVIVGLSMSGIRLGKGFIKKVPRADSYKIYPELHPTLKTQKFVFLKMDKPINQRPSPFTGMKWKVLTPNPLTVGEINGVAAFIGNSFVANMQLSDDVFKPLLNKPNIKFIEKTARDDIRRRQINEGWEKVTKEKGQAGNAWGLKEKFIISPADPTYIRFYKDNKVFLTRPLTKEEISSGELPEDARIPGGQFTYSVKTVVVDEGGLKDEVKKKMEDARKKILNDFDKWQYGRLSFKDGQYVPIFLEK